MITQIFLKMSYFKMCVINNCIVIKTGAEAQNRLFYEDFLSYDSIHTVIKFTRKTIFPVIVYLLSLFYFFHDNFYQLN